MVKSAAKRFSSRLSPFRSSFKKSSKQNGASADEQNAESDAILTKEKNVNITKSTDLSPSPERTEKISQLSKKSLDDENDKKLEILLEMFNTLKGADELRYLLGKNNADFHREMEDGGIYPISPHIQKKDTTGTPPRYKNKGILRNQLPTPVRNALQNRQIPAPVESINLPNSKKGTRTTLGSFFKNIRCAEYANRAEEDHTKWNDAISVITMETLEQKLERLATNNEKSTSNSMLTSEQSDDIRDDSGVHTRGDCHSTMAESLCTFMTCNSDNSQGSISSLTHLANFLQRNLGPGFEVIKHRSAEAVNSVKEKSGKIVNEAYDGILDGAEYATEAVRDKTEKTFVRVKNKAGESAYDVYREAYWQVDDAKMYLWKVSKCGGEEVEEESTVFVEKWIKPTIDTIREQDIKQSVFVMASVEQDVEVADGRGFRDLSKSNTSNEDRDGGDLVMPLETNEEILTFMYKLTESYL